MNPRDFLQVDTRTPCLASRNSRNLVAVHRTVMVSLINVGATSLEQTHLDMTGFARETAVSRLLVWLARLDPLHRGVVTA